MNNLTLRMNNSIDSTHAGYHHRFRMIYRLQTPSNPTTHSYWLLMAMVCSNSGRIRHNVGVICPKRKKSIILMATTLHLFSILRRVATPCNNTMARKRRRNICATRYRCYDACKCSSIQDIMECMSKTAC